MNAQELTRHYADIRKRLMAPPALRVAPRVSPVPAINARHDPFRVRARFAEFTASAFLVQKIGWDRFAGTTVRNIMLACCEFYQVSKEDMLSPRRNKQVVYARQVAMYLCRKLTMRSMPEIGMKLGGRDHTTVMHGVAKIEKLLQTDAETQRDIDFLMSVIGGRA